MIQPRFGRWGKSNTRTCAALLRNVSRNVSWLPQRVPENATTAPKLNAALTLFARYPDGMPCVGPASAAVKAGVVERA